jgi:membrane-associated phospholipid phosphatase
VTAVSIGYQRCVSITKPAGERTVWDELRTAGKRFLPAWFAVGVAVVLLGLLITKVLENTGFADADAGLDRWLEKQRTPTGETLTHIGTLFGETPTIIGLTAITVVAFRVVFHRWRESVILAICVTGQAVIFLVTTLLIDRHRPPVQQLDDSPPTSSFPSGHTAASTAYYLGTALIIAWHTRQVWLRWLLIVVGVLIPIMVASCRLYRGMHYPTDTATSFLLGLALLFFAFRALPLSGGRPDVPDGRDDGRVPRRRMTAEPTQPAARSVQSAKATQPARSAPSAADLAGRTRRP